MKLVQERQEEKMEGEALQRSVVMSGQLPEVAVNVVGIAALGFQLNGHVFDSEIRRDPVLDQPQ